MDILHNIQDLVANPKQYAEMVVDRLRNFNRGEKAVVSDQGAGMVPMTLEERAQQVTQGALDNIGGGGVVGSISPKLVMKMLRPESEHFKRMAAGETPEAVMRALRLPDKPEFIAGSMFPNNPVRYETSRRLFDPGVVHYDATGGPQTLDVMAGTRYWPTGGSRPKASREKLDANSQFRVGDYSLINPEDVIVTPRDRWAYAYTGRHVPEGKHEFYRNDFEGNMFNDITGMAAPSAKDVLNDPELRAYWNFSLAVPSNSKLHMMSKILKEK
jgi:hypothetical protein